MGKLIESQKIDTSLSQIRQCEVILTVYLKLIRFCCCNPSLSQLYETTTENS